MARIIQRVAQGAQEHLFSAPLRVGRDKSLTIHLDDPKCSREHAYFYIVEEDRRPIYWVRDLGSRNGTFVNNRKLSAPTRLSDGDVVRIGSSEFVFRLDRTEVPSRPAPPRRSESKPLEVPRRPVVGSLVRMLMFVAVFAASTWGSKLLASRYLESMFGS